MTKEELKQEAQEWLCNNLHSASEEDFIKAMVDIAEPREKRIAELEQENKVLAQNLEDTEIVNKALEKENAELKKENQKWKDGIALKDEEIGCIETDFNTFKSKAKELLKRWVELYKPKLEGYPITPIQEQTEQFISEVE